LICTAPQRVAVQKSERNEGSIHRPEGAAQPSVCGGSGQPESLEMASTRRPPRRFVSTLRTPPMGLATPTGLARRWSPTEQAIEGVGGGRPGRSTTILRMKVKRRRRGAAWRPSARVAAFRVRNPAMREEEGGEGAAAAGRIGATGYRIERHPGRRAAEELRLGTVRAPRERTRI